MCNQSREFGQAFHQHGELVTAHPGHCVGRPHAAEQPLGGLDEQRIPGGMTQAVVDQFEVVQIHRQHCHRLVVVSCTCTACISRSLNRSRFARPVSVSRNAWSATNLSSRWFWRTTTNCLAITAVISTADEQ